MYYATFTVILVVALGVVAAIRAGRWRSLLAPAVIVVAMAAAIATTLAPDVLARADASTAGGFARPVQDSDRYGLRIAQMVLPLPTTRIPGLGGIAERSYWIESVGDYGASIGPLAVVGLVAIGWSTLRRIGRPRDQVDRTVARLAAIAATSVLVAAAGAGGLLLAAAGFTQTRVWSRMAAFVGFAALAGLALLVQRRVGRRRLLWPWVVAIAMLALVEHPLVPPTAPIRTAVREDAALVHSLEDALPSGAEVLSLPVVPFPDDLGSERLLAPSLLSDDLRFSAGEFKGGPGDWQQSWFTGDLADDTFLAAVAGFDALVLQRSHTLVDDPALADADMANAAGQPVWTSDDGTWSWVDLRPLRARLDQRAGTAAVRDAGAAVTRPIGITLGDRRLLTWTHDEVVQHLGPDASIDLHRLDDDPGPAELSLDIGAADGATVEVDAPGADTVRVRPGVDGERVTITVPTLDDVTTVRIRSDGPETRFDGGTPASVWVADVRARDSRGIELVDALR